MSARAPRGGAGPNGFAHFETLARRLTPSRRRTLRALADHGPLSPDQLVDLWLLEQPSTSPSYLRTVPRMVNETLWKLTNLGYISPTPEGTHQITALGTAAIAYRA
ncbi:MAG TPA: hypothetical protein VGP24_13855 [Glaciihabitans sp.]|jgi:hypothetical protein|nr:hypothetical protein [Glaciihabitans sp.]